MGYRGNAEEQSYRQLPRWPCNTRVGNRRVCRNTYGKGYHRQSVYRRPTLFCARTGQGVHAVAGTEAAGMASTILRIVARGGSSIDLFIYAQESEDCALA